MAVPLEIISLANDREDGSSLEDKDSELSEQEQERRKRNCQASKRLRMKLSQRHEQLKKKYLEESEKNTKFKYEVHREEMHLMKWVAIAENLKTTCPTFDYRLNISQELAKHFAKKGNGDTCSRLFTKIMTTGKELAIMKKPSDDKNAPSTNQLSTVAADQLKDVGMFNNMAYVSSQRIPPTDQNVSGSELVIPDATSSITSETTVLDQLETLKRLADTITENSQRTDPPEVASSNIQLGEVMDFPQLMQNTTSTSEVLSHPDDVQADDVKSVPEVQTDAYLASQDSNILPATLDAHSDIGNHPPGPSSKLAIPDFEMLTPTQVEDDADNRPGKRTTRPKNNRGFKKKSKYSSRTTNKGKLYETVDTQDILTSGEQNLAVDIHPGNLCHGFQPNDMLQQTGQCNKKEIANQHYIPPLQAIEAIKADLLQGTTPDMFYN